ncbi:MAG: ABC transporter substrate-binding protein [Holosporales bacterium]|jgi:putative ABC transport system substrate-binding protein|nr:ABC transporter substrate-binding protein [Holosporales bacterium]
MMKKIIALLLGLSGIPVSHALLPENAKPVKIGVCKAIEHEALNSVVAGMEGYFKQQKINYQLSVETCQGNMALGSQAIAKFVNSGFNIIVTVGTLPTQCAYSVAKSGKAKVIFGSVTNPKDISVNIASVSITGISNFVDLEPQIKMFQDIQPSLKTLGILYNTGEANSLSIVRELRDMCAKNNLKLIEQGVYKVSDIPQACEKLSASVDAIFISNDNLALSCIGNIVKVCTAKKIPVYVSDTDQVKNGCVAALGPNQYNIGVQVGKIVERIAAGEDNIPIQYPETVELRINLKAAKASGVTIPDTILSRAKEIIRE